MAWEKVKERHAIADQALIAIGRARQNPFYRSGQLLDSDAQAVAMMLPHGSSPQIQVMDSSSPDYAKFYFLVDFSDVGGEDVIP